MKNKKLRVRLGLVVLLVCIGFMMFALNETKGGQQKSVLVELMNYEETEIDKVLIRHGGSGEANVFTDSNSVQSILNYISSIKVEQKNMADSTGGEYSIELYKGDEFVGDIAFITPTLVRVSGSYYEVLKSNGYDLAPLIP